MAAIQVQKALEMILARAFAGTLAMPIFLVDPEGTLVYYNEPAERVLGHRFEDTGETVLADWASFFQPSSDNEEPMKPDSLPLVIALREGRPAHRDFWIRGLDNVTRHIEVTAFPVIGQAGTRWGAMAIFWEVGE